MSEGVREGGKEGGKEGRKGECLHTNFHLSIVQRTILDTNKLTQQLGMAILGSKYEKSGALF